MSDSESSIPRFNVCKIPGCAKKVFGYGWCGMHYARWRNNGDPNVVRNIRGPLEERFWARVRRGGPDECWVWEGEHGREGYGQLVHQRRHLKAHRVAWELTHGPIPEGMIACHTCDNPPCVNPAHLFIGTPRDNIDDRHRKGRDARGERITISALTVAQVLEIRQLYNDGGLTLQAMARQYGVAHSTISGVVHRRTWRHI